MKQNVLRTAAAALAVTLASVAACDRSPVEQVHPGIGTVAITDRGAVPQVVLATWTHDGGWDRDILATVSHAAEGDRTRIVLGVRMWNRADEEYQLVEGGEYEARYGVVSDPASVVDMDPSRELFHGDHVYVYGHHADGRTGTAELRFVLWHDGHSDGETDPVGLTFTN